MQPHGNANCLRTPNGRNIFDLNTGDEIHNSVVVSSLSHDLSYRLKDEYNIKDEMLLGDLGIECPIKDLRPNLEPIVAS